MNIKYRVGDLEVRTTKNLDDKPYYEIVKWQSREGEKEYCYTLAIWDKNKEGYDLRFVGSRPFEVEGFIEMAERGQKLLDIVFDEV